MTKSQIRRMPVVLEIGSDEARPYNELELKLHYMECYMMAKEDRQHIPENRLINPDGFDEILVRYDQLDKLRSLGLVEPVLIETTFQGKRLAWVYLTDMEVPLTRLGNRYSNPVGWRRNSYHVARRQVHFTVAFRRLCQLMYATRPLGRPRSQQDALDTYKKLARLA